MDWLKAMMGGLIGQQQPQQAQQPQNAASGMQAGYTQGPQAPMMQPPQVQNDPLMSADSDLNPLEKFNKMKQGAMGGMGGMMGGGQGGEGGGFMDMFNFGGF